MNNFWNNLTKPSIGLSPMDGITDFPMREIQSEIYKPDVMYTEFISCEGYIRKPEIFLRNLKYSEKQRPIVAQVFGHTPQAFYETVKSIAKMGFDGIDLNMGCPAKTVIHKGGGGALIGNYDLVEKIINESLRAISDSGVDLPLSIKTRIGKKESEVEKWIDFLSKFPISQITLHGRVLKQGHGGEVDWEEIHKAGEILKKKNIVFFANGGIKNLKEAREKCQKYNLDGVLIGQATLGNPWFFEGKEDVSKEEKLNTILKHAKTAWDFYQEKGFVIVLKHFGWYSKGFENSKELKLKLFACRNYNEVEKVILEFEEESNKESF